MLADINRHQVDEVENLLEIAALPAADIASADWFSLVGWQDAGRIVGAGGLERCGSNLLLRSVVVAQSHQKRGIADDIVAHLQQKAADAGYKDLYLLTETAITYFSQKLGWQVVKREHVPRDIASSSQFSSLCPDSATLMKLEL